MTVIPRGGGRAPLRRSRQVRAGLVQLLLALAGLALGMLVPRITGGPDAPARQVADVLVALGFGVLGTTVVIFSLLFLVVQWAHTSFTPRLTLFRQSPIVWWTFAFSIGLAVFCVTAALAIGDSSDVSVAVPVVTAILLLAMLTLLRALLLRALSSIQLAPVLRSITERGSTALDTLYPADTSPAASEVSVDNGPPAATVTWRKPAAVLQQIDVRQLREAAREADAVIVLHKAPGGTLRPGAKIADVYGAAIADTTVLGSLATGLEPTFEQDPMLAFRLLADIALRALSSSINDPATAAQALDCMADLLGGPAARRAGEAGPLRVAGPDGAVRVVIRRPSWEEFVRTGIDDVIVAALNSPLVLTRLRTLLADLEPGAHPHGRDLLNRRRAWVEREMAGRFPVLWREAPPTPHPQAGGIG
ncbi:DUF2254 family protein [Streptomyces sp. NPDC079020]|uniref:DUF2254 family protein n=1 Tax=Streptomyces sp. NPDC079020 TaxID=3365722 RepID=UPI0037D5D41B